MAARYQLRYKDIVNREIVTLKNCEHEPIHIPGSIQPHGFLLAADPADWTVQYCSGNIGLFLALDYSAVLGKSIERLFGAEALDRIVSHMQAGEAMPLKLELLGMPFLVNVHSSGPHCIIEAEPHASGREMLSDIYRHTVGFVSYMNTTTTLKELCDRVAAGTREITGYDRVMVYRFDAQYNGEIFAESCAGNLEPFLGLHYPHTDIPSQARELYLRNLLRLIVDVGYDPVPVYTADDGREKFLDLSLSVLRSTSPIHVEYLANMGVKATLTISLIHKGRLWGLLACHHYSPKNLTPEIRLAAQIQGQFITSQIDVRQSNEEYEVSRNTNIALEKLNALRYPAAFDSFSEICARKELLEVCNAEGVSILAAGGIYKSGTVPSDAEILHLNGILSEKFGEAYHTDSIAGLVPGMDCGPVSGVLFYGLGNGNCVMWYRPERIAEINWGGDPEKSIVHDHLGMHPRNSFGLFKQIVKCRSAAWLQPELNSSANCAHGLHRQISMMLLAAEEEKFRMVNEALKETNAELENINWISTHDLQEPLRKIQILASKALLDPEVGRESHSVVDSLQKMTKSANRMQTLLTDIMKYTQIKYTREAFETVELDGILKEVLLDSEDALSEKGAEVDCPQLPQVYAIPFLMKQLFSNIIHNSLKYAAEGRSPQIRIAADSAERKAEGAASRRYVRIAFSDNGIGFEQRYAESIFKIFTRLHDKEEYGGSGVGLALCRKIMQTNNGLIEASGKPGVGATITLYFPVS